MVCFIRYEPKRFLSKLLVFIYGLFDSKRKSSNTLFTNRFKFLADGNKKGLHGNAGQFFYLITFCFQKRLDQI